MEIEQPRPPQAQDVSTTKTTNGDDISGSIQRNGHNIDGMDPQDSPDNNEKRKSVSFIDEKLIINAIKSTNISDAPNATAVSAATAAAVANVSAAPVKRSNSLKTNQNGGNHQQQHHANHHQNGGGGGNKRQTMNNQKHYSNNHHHQQQPFKHHHPKTGGYKTPATTTPANPVIIYYSNPEVEINVDDLLNKCQAQPAKPSSQSEDSKIQSKFEKQPQQQQKSNQSNQSMSNNNKNYHHSRNNQWGRGRGRGGQRGGGGGYGGPSNHQNHHHNNNQFKKYSDHDDRCADGKNYLPSNGNATGGFNNHKRRGGGGGGFKDNHAHNHHRNNYGQSDSSNKMTAKPADPITIYYNDSSVSLEENLERLKSKLKQQQENGTALNGDDEETKSQSSQQPQQPERSDVIKPDVKAENASDTKNASDGIKEQSPPTIVSAVSNDHEDVISGGVPIDNPRWPNENGPQKVICTLVSHPGHFYIKFLNDEHQQQLRSMTSFYQNDIEHIDLTIDVLKPGQYFAANTDDENGAQWIRVKLLHVESDDSINCLLIDKGCFGVFKLNKLQPLYNRFRSVPKQAIRVSLSDVRPKECDWLPNEALEFKQLVENRRLNIGKHNGANNEIIDPDCSTIEIELYFDAQDANAQLANKSVADVLVERNIAKKKD